jgi:hypothetical protein
MQRGEQHAETDRQVGDKRGDAAQRQEIRW